MVKANLAWRSPLTALNLNNIIGIAIHHMAHVNADEHEVHRWHLGRGWKGNGYNYFIRFDGTIVEVRGLNVGAGVLGNNTTLLSVGLQGNFDVQTPTNEQLTSLRNLITYLKTLCRNVKYVDGHNKWTNTSCPGKLFPLNMFKEDGITLPINNDKRVLDERVRAYQTSRELVVDGIVGVNTITSLMNDIDVLDALQDALKTINTLSK